MPPAPQTAAQAQHEVHEQNERMKAEALKRRAPKPTDKNIPEGVEDLIIGDGVQQYRRLREVERKLDAMMMRKKFDIHDSEKHNPKRWKSLQIWISNTAENQPWQARSLETDMFDFNSGVEGTFRVKIEGRLLDDGSSDEDTESESGDEDDRKSTEQEKLDGSTDQKFNGTQKQPPVPIANPIKTRLSHFFKSITVSFDRSKNLQPDSTTQIEWKKPSGAENSALSAAHEFDSLEFERKGEENINCTISFWRDEAPERFRLSKALAELLDTEEDDRASVIYGIWEYVKAMDLQQDEEKRLIQCNERLRDVNIPSPPRPPLFQLTHSNPQIFKTETIFFPELSILIGPHLTALPPLSVPYTIRVDPNYHKSPTPTIYTLRVRTPSPLLALRATVKQQPLQTLRQISAHDDNLATLMQALTHSKAKHAFLSEMSRDPVGFMQRWIKSQKRDLEVILGEVSKGEESMGEEWRRGGKDGVWGTQNVRESVGLMVQKQRG